MVLPFLSLPLEIRIPIYRDCLPYSKLDCRKDESTRVITPAEEGLIRWYNGVCPSILFANRQTHAEACEILYHENTFTIYVRHPRHARLPMNESRADEDSFVHISWKHRNWAHPRNHKIPLAIVRSHSHFSHICRVQINLPDINQLLAADMYMRTVSYASHHGLSAWVDKLRASNGQPSEEEQERMDYIDMIKRPVDEVAEVLQALPRINELVLLLTAESYEVTFVEFVLSGLLQLCGVQHVQILYKEQESLRPPSGERAKLRTSMMEPRLRDLEKQMESGPSTQAAESVDGISPEALEMLQMLRSMRRRLLLYRQLKSDFMNTEGGLTIPPSGEFDHILAE